MSRRKQAARGGRKRSRKTASKPLQRPVEYVGRLSMTREGFAFLEVIPQEGQEAVEDIFIPARKLGGALHGDTVRVAARERKAASRAGGRGASFGRKETALKKLEGEVFYIVERSPRPYIGILQVHRKEAFVITNSKNMPYDISVPADNLKGAQNGEKVAALVTGWDRKLNLPVGEIVDVLGAPGANETEMHAILAEFGLPYRFEPEVEREAASISEAIDAAALQNRRDFRSVPTFTIDPSDAKDFDDALSYQPLGKNRWEVGIHIADVSYYVTPGSLLDQAAYERGNSVYLVDRTVPMLPEKLSNRLCSLRPNEDKLCYSAVFELDEKAHVRARWFGRTVIHSQCRMAYHEAQEVLEGATEVVARESGPIPAAIVEALKQLHTLAARLRQVRFDAGAIAFERPETKVLVDEQGRPIDVVIKETKEANWLIEEFMLLANKEVATYIGKKKEAKAPQPPVFVYRVHEAPSQDKMAAFQQFVHHCGLALTPSYTAQEYAHNLNKLLASLKDKPQCDGVIIMALRSMARAQYDINNCGHYGLAFDFYTHFTSPIRRYSDLMVHRLLTHYLEGGASVPEAEYKEYCRHVSQREVLATEAERASIKYKLVEFMQDKVGQIYEGTVSGITEWGIYVEIDGTQIEGMIPVREMEDDYYLFDKEALRLIGKHAHRVFALGTRVRVQVERANLEQKQLDYKLIN